MFSTTANGMAAQFWKICVECLPIGFQYSWYIRSHSRDIAYVRRQVFDYGNDVTLRDK